MARKLLRVKKKKNNPPETELLFDRNLSKGVLTGGL